MSLWSTGFAVRSAQDLEDLATASWLSETLFAALELDLFATLGDADLPVAELAERCVVDPEALDRLAQALQVLGLVSLHEGHVAATSIAHRHLVPGGPGFLGHSLSYRRRLARTWPTLAQAVREGGSTVRPPEDEPEEAYHRRIMDYVLAMDDVARHKAALIVDRVEVDGLPPAVLDIAGGAGAIAAAFLRSAPEWHGAVADLPDVMRQADRVWRERIADHDAGAAGLRQRLELLGLDLLTDGLPPAPTREQRWGVVVTSNIVHAYAAEEASSILRMAADALDPDGILLVHDFWTDGRGRGPAKSALFDLHMLLNTYQGRTYPWTWATALLEEHGLATRAPVPLGERPGDEDTALVAAAWDPAALERVRLTPLERLDTVARRLGFRRAAALAPAEVVTAAWVEEKCRYGCSGYGRGGQCPPRSPRAADLREVLASYTEALLVEGEPPGAAFHGRMLALEKEAFLGGHHRALAFVAGPCRLCPECVPNDCRHPRSARPAMEASGIDVYATAAAVGWDLRVVTRADDPVTYLGLLLVG